MVDARYHEHLQTFSCIYVLFLIGFVEIAEYDDEMIMMMKVIMIVMNSRYNDNYNNNNDNEAR